MYSERVVAALAGPLLTPAATASTDETARSLVTGFNISTPFLGVVPLTNTGRGTVGGSSAPPANESPET
jgi:hypothetical protein